MPSLLEIANAAAQLKVPRNHTILVYGDPKSGKTRLAATLAKIPSVRSIHYFDGENGSDTLTTMFRQKLLSEEAAKKIVLHKIVDTPDHPYFIETMLKVLLVTQAPWEICPAHGRVKQNCKVCAADKATVWDRFHLPELGQKDWVVIDTGSQLANSSMESTMRGADYTTKPGWDEYGVQGRHLSDILTTIQAAPTNFLVITHQCVLKENTYKDKDSKAAPQAIGNTIKLYPLMGTQNFSLNVAKYFGTVIYMDQKMKKHVAGSSSTYDSDMITGSRIDMRIEKEAEADLSLVLPKLGLYPAVEPQVPVADQTAVAPKA